MTPVRRATPKDAALGFAPKPDPLREPTLRALRLDGMSLKSLALIENWPVPTASAGAVRADGTVVHTWVQGEAVSEWLPGEQHQLTTSTVLPDLPRGSYQLMVGVRQASDGDRIQLPLTTSRTDGWYPVSSVSVV